MPRYYNVYLNPVTDGTCRCYWWTPAGESPERQHLRVSVDRALLQSLFGDRWYHTESVPQ